MASTTSPFLYNYTILYSLLPDLNSFKRECMPKSCNLYRDKDTLTTESKGMRKGYPSRLGNSNFFFFYHPIYPTKIYIPSYVIALLKQFPAPETYYVLYQCQF